MEIWRVTLAIWLVLSGVIWMIGPSFPLAFLLMGIFALVAAVFLVLNK